MNESQWEKAIFAFSRTVQQEPEVLDLVLLSLAVSLSN